MTVVSLCCVLFSGKGWDPWSLPGQRLIDPTSDGLLAKNLDVFSWLILGLAE